MTHIDIILLIIIAFMLVIIAILVSRCCYINNKIKNLTLSINKHNNDGSHIEFSTEDNNFAMLENAVCDLADMLELEKSKTVAQYRKNSQFIADVSHQLKTPLAGLRLYCELENSDNPTQHTQNELLLIDKMEKLIYQLLRLEKIKDDSYVMEFNKNNIEVIVKEKVDELHHLFKKKQFYINGTGVIRCDRAWLSEAIANVIKNSCEHTDDSGKINIDISDSENSLTVTISDNGGGVPANELQNLFVRFHTAQNALPTSAGIGLAITKAIVEKHHGTICAKNTNEGLSVIMCFPHIDGVLLL